MGEYQAYYQRLLDEDLQGFEFARLLQVICQDEYHQQKSSDAFNVYFFQYWCPVYITSTIDQLNSLFCDRALISKIAPKTFISSW